MTIVVDQEGNLITTKTVSRKLFNGRLVSGFSPNRYYFLIGNSSAYRFRRSSLADGSDGGEFVVLILAEQADPLNVPSDDGDVFGG